MGAWGQELGRMTRIILLICTQVLYIRSVLTNTPVKAGCPRQGDQASQFLLLAVNNNRAFSSGESGRDAPGVMR